jgi:hypothetical protein
MSRSSARTRTHRAVDEVLQAARFLPGLSSSARRLDGLLEQQQAMRGLASALHAHELDAAVMRRLVLQSEVPRQLCSCLAAALQQLASAATIVSPEEPALAAAAHMALLIALPLCSVGSDFECTLRLATEVQGSGEQQQTFGVVALCALLQSTMHMRHCCCTVLIDVALAECSFSRSDPTSPCNST